MKTTPLATLETPRLFANAIRCARRLAKRAGSSTIIQKKTPAKSNRQFQTYGQPSIDHLYTESVPCRRLQPCNKSQASDRSSKCALKSSQAGAADSSLLPYADLQVDLHFQHSVFINVNPDSPLMAAPNKFANIMQVGIADVIVPPRFTASGEADFGQLTSPLAGDVRYLRSFPVPCVPPPAATVLAVTHTCANYPPAQSHPSLPCADLSAFLQGAAWAAGLCGLSRTGPGLSDMLPSSFRSEIRQPSPSSPLPPAWMYVGAKSA